MTFSKKVHMHPKGQNTPRKTRREDRPFPKTVRFTPVCFYGFSRFSRFSRPRLVFVGLFWP